MSAPYDVLIVGSGPAAMSAALTLGRARLSTLIVSDERPRNRVVKASHGLFTRDGASPEELLSIAKMQLQRYQSIHYRVARILEIGEETLGFSALDDSGQRHAARRVLLATGMRDDLAAAGLPGLDAVYGRSVFPCPFCDGFEHRHDALAVFTVGGGEELLHHYLAMIRTLSSSDLVWFANGRPVSAALRTELQSRDIHVEAAPVQALLHIDGQLRAVRLADGREVARDAGFVGGDYARPSPLVAQLGLDTEPHPAGWTVARSETLGRSSRPGVYLAGDVRMGFAGLAQAVWQGTQCASGIVQEVAMERWG